jgi:hypothetical protein
MRRLVATLLFGLGSIVAARAEVANCIQISSVPFVITQQGTHCLKSDLATSMSSGTAITVNNHNVIIDLNGYKLGGLGAGENTNAIGISASGRQNVTIRNGTIRGFRINVYFDGAGSSGHIIENIRSESARGASIALTGSNSVVRNNLVNGTGLPGKTDAYGITLAGENISVLGNIINGVTASQIVRGIAAFEATAVIVDGNEIRGLQGNLKFGVSLDGPRHVIRNNTIVNSVAGSYGISADPGSGCIDNVISNFAIPLTGCAYSTGNATY